MDIAEKRVYDATAERTRLAVATEAGLAIVGISDDVIGEFGLAIREPIRAIAALGEGRVLVATADRVRLVALGAAEIAAVEHDAATGLGATTALSVAGDHAIAAGEDGVVRRLPIDGLATGIDTTGAADAENWDHLGEVPPVRRADGPLLATAEGVYRIAEGTVSHAGLEEVRDVAAAGPFAAAESGIYRLGPGWTAEYEDSVDRVAALAREDGGLPELAHAADGATLLERADGTWSEAEWPSESAVGGIDYAPATAGSVATYAVTEDGTVLADAGDGWRTRSIGLPGVVDCAVVE